jgi:hypothetical protein
MYPIALLVWLGYLLNVAETMRKQLRLLFPMEQKNTIATNKNSLQLTYLFSAIVFLASWAIGYILVFILEVSIY